MESARFGISIKSREQVVLAIAAFLFLLIVLMEWMFPLNVVGAFGFVLPILLVATLRSRRLMIVTLGLFAIAALLGLLARGRIKRGTPPVPELAIREAKLTSEALKSDGHN